MEERLGKEGGEGGVISEGSGVQRRLSPPQCSQQYKIVVLIFLKMFPGGETDGETEAWDGIWSPVEKGRGSSPVGLWWPLGTATTLSVQLFPTARSDWD